MAAIASARVASPQNPGKRPASPAGKRPTASGLAAPSTVLLMVARAGSAGGASGRRAAGPSSAGASSAGPRASPSAGGAAGKPSRIPAPGVAPGSVPKAGAPSAAGSAGGACASPRSRSVSQSIAEIGSCATPSRTQSTRPSAAASAARGNRPAVSAPIDDPGGQRRHDLASIGREVAEIGERHEADETDQPQKDDSLHDLHSCPRFPVRPLPLTCEYIWSLARVHAIQRMFDKKGVARWRGGSIGRSCWWA